MLGGARQKEERSGDILCRHAHSFLLNWLMDVTSAIIPDGQLAKLYYLYYFPFEQQYTTETYESASRAWYISSLGIL